MQFTALTPLDIEEGLDEVFITTDALIHGTRGNVLLTVTNTLRNVEVEVFFTSPLTYKPVIPLTLTDLCMIAKVIELYQDKIKSILVKWMQSNMKNWDI